MGKSTHFSGQPLYGQVIKLLDKSKIFQISRENSGIKVHTVIHANEGVPSDIKFTSAATNDSFSTTPRKTGSMSLLNILKGLRNRLFLIKGACLWTITLGFAKNQWVINPFEAFSVFIGQQ